MVPHYTVVAKESTKTKQTITNNDLVVDLPTKILDENINFKKQNYKKILRLMDGNV
jgi:hypothetical protein